MRISVRVNMRRKVPQMGGCCVVLASFGEWNLRRQRRRRRRRRRRRTQRRSDATTRRRRTLWCTFTDHHRTSLSWHENCLHPHGVA